MMGKTKYIILMIVAVMLIFIAACGADTTSPPDVSVGAETQVDTGDDLAAQSDEHGSPAGQTIVGRDGSAIKLPDRIDTIISMGPSNTEILVALGLSEKIIAVDSFSDNIPGLDSNLPMFDMIAPDGEQILSMMPDVIFLPGMVLAAADDPFRVLSDAGICLIYIPSSTSIEGIMDDIRFIAYVMGVGERAGEIVSDMAEAVDRIRGIGETIEERRSVYFEVSPSPHLVSFGTGVFLNEMIEIIGASNVLAEDIDGWRSISDEVILAADPDVILTSVNFIDDPVGEIMERTGWSGITAVRDGAVHFIDTDASNRPSHNIVRALQEMAVAIYPEYFQ